MIFSQNQNRHVFVNKTAAKDSLAGVTTAGDIYVGGPSDHKSMYFNYMTPGGLIRSDIVKKENILWVRATQASDMAYKLKQVLVNINSLALDSGNPIPGEDYILHIKVKQFIGASEESTYHKFGAVHAVSGMTPREFYLKMAKSLAINFSRDINKFFQFGVMYSTTSGGGTITETFEPVNANSNLDNTTAYPASSSSISYTGVVIRELSQKPEWRVGTKPFTGVNFSVYASPINNGTESFVWALNDDYNNDIKTTNYDSVENTPIIADLEWDAMVERADVYKNVGWPYVINTTYLVDHLNTNGYDTVDIHFYFVDSKEGAQKSEKTITIVCPAGTGSGTTHDIIQALIGKINTQCGGSNSLIDLSAPEYAWVAQ